MGNWKLIPLAILTLASCGARTPLDLPQLSPDASIRDSSFDHTIADGHASDATDLDGGSAEAALHGPLRVFITTDLYEANLGGLTGADGACQAEANGAGLSGSFMAWLSDATGSPSTRFALNGGPYVRVDGVVLAKDWADLTDGAIDAPINVTATGQVLTLDAPPSSANYPVWTATYPDGSVDTYCFNNACEYCDNWSTTSMDFLGATADYRTYNQSVSPGSWSIAGPVYACGVTTAHLFCFEQPS